MSLYNDSTSVYRDVYEQYVEVASHLWLLRDLAVNRPDYTIREIEALEKRLDLQLDGILTSLDDGWAACEAALDGGEAGEIFTAAVIGMRSHDLDHIRVAVERGLADEKATKGLISAMGWLPAQLAGPWIEKFLKGKDLNHKFLGVAACSVRRLDPGEMLVTILERNDCLQHEKLHARSLRLVGELRRQDLMPAVMKAMATKSDTIRFWSTWAAIVLGNKQAVQALKPYVLQVGPWHSRALQLAFRVLPLDQARQWISEMAKDKTLRRSMVTATGVLGDPQAVNWLISKMQDPDLARLAGEAFCMITGADLERLQATRQPLEGKGRAEANPEDEEDVVLDEDEHLPWPDMRKVADLWQRNGRNFIVGQRYFMGRPLALDTLKEISMNGYQRQRHAAVLELALVDPLSRLVNTRARVIL